MSATQLMIFQRPATKSGPLFDLLAEYIGSDDRPDPMTIARLKRDVSAVLKTADVAQGHILFSGIAVLEWDIEQAVWHVAQAARHDSSVPTLMNATVTFGALNRPDLAIPYALTAAVLAPSNRDVVNETSGLLVAVGRVADALKLQTACPLDSSSRFAIDAARLSKAMQVAQVTEDWLTEEFSIARKVLSDARLRARHFFYETEEDPDGGPHLAFEFGFNGNLDDEFRLEDELACRLAETDRWNPSRLSVHMKYVESAEDAVVTI